MLNTILCISQQNELRILISNASFDEKSTKKNKSDRYVPVGREGRKKPPETSETLEENFFPQYIVLLSAHQVPHIQKLCL